jgi:hypothetical protein
MVMNEAASQGCERTCGLGDGCVRFQGNSYFASNVCELHVHVHDELRGQLAVTSRYSQGDKWKTFVMI